MTKRVALASSGLMAGLILVAAPLTSAATVSKSCTIGGVKATSTVNYSVVASDHRHVNSVSISIPSGQLDYWVYDNHTFDTGIQRATGRSKTVTFPSSASYYSEYVWVYGGKANDGYGMCQMYYNLVR